jgi:uncharacterized protein
VRVAREDPAVRRLRLRMLPGAFAVCRLDAGADIPETLTRAHLVSITRTDAELAIVCPEELAPPDARCERGFTCLVVEGPLPFSAVGILAALAGPLAEAGIPILALSTYDTDYVLLRTDRLEAARAALSAAGHEVG